MKNLRSGGKKKSPEKLIVNCLSYDLQQYDGDYWKESRNEENNENDAEDGLMLLTQVAEASERVLTLKPRDIEVRAYVKSFFWRSSHNKVNFSENPMSNLRIL